jgi:methylenetetrahydrofolate reductase (NADPH)
MVIPDAGTPATRAPAINAAELNRRASELVASGSIEMSAHRPGDAAAIARVLPVGTPVFVNHLPRHSMAETLATLVAVRAAGLEPVPHLAARRFTSRAEARWLIDSAVQQANVKKVLLIGGDIGSIEGPYTDAAALLRDGLIAQHGIAEVGFAGYPDGHPVIPVARCAAALDEKLALAASQGLGTFIVTQFSFAPRRIIDFCEHMGRHAPDVPVYVGIAGPANPVALLKFAQRCGVGASLRALQTRGLDAVRLGMRTNPDEQVRALAEHWDMRHPCNVVGTHLFSFGGVEASARWMQGWISARGAH